ncbi:MAG TPA: DUF2062 domain-containing protein [Candidatus Omnitrophota bacterium]|nr:DUF2062 domain-containing protein [Candidatus Omnitrophota bacterium]HQQ06393.1 DUF2062 domain-containing protein [Candidatus Omnitrophota bacterium]
MNKKAFHNRIIRFFKVLYLKLFRINDSPQRVSLGFGVGAFVGFLPGTGPIAALVLAALFRINKAAALLGSLLTNTWLSFLTIILSIKIGSRIMGLEWHQVYDRWQELLKDFHWKQLLDVSILKLILPVLTGYLVLSFCLAIAVYIGALVILTMLKRRRDEDKNRAHISR